MFPKFCNAKRKINSLLDNLFYFVNEFRYAFIEINSSHCIILWGQDFWNKIASIILLIFTSRGPHLNGYRSSSIDHHLHLLVARDRLDRFTWLWIMRRKFLDVKTRQGRLAWSHWIISCCVCSTCVVGTKLARCLHFPTRCNNTLTKLPYVTKCGP